MLWCNGKQQNETMVLESNYDNRFAGVDVDAKAGAANGKIIICSAVAAEYVQQILVRFAQVF